MFLKNTLCKVQSSNCGSYPSHAFEIGYQVRNGTDWSKIPLLWFAVSQPTGTPLGVAHACFSDAVGMFWSRRSMIHFQNVSNSHLLCCSDRHIFMITPKSTPHACDCNGHLLVTVLIAAHRVLKSNITLVTNPAISGNMTSCWN